jgi:hypothetical protein
LPSTGWKATSLPSTGGWSAITIPAPPWRNCALSLSGALAAASAYEATGERQYAAQFDQARETASQSLSRLPATTAAAADEGPTGGDPARSRRGTVDPEVSLLQSPPDPSAGSGRLNRAKAAMTGALAAGETLRDQQERQFAEAVGEREEARRACSAP